MLKAISVCLRREIPHDLAGLALYDSATGQLRPHALEFPHNQNWMNLVAAAVPIPLEGTPEGRAFSSRQPVLIRSLSLTEFPAEIMKRGAAEGLKSGCTVPLISHHQVLGTLSVVSKHELAFNEDDLELLNQIGTQIAIAVENALNFERARAAEQQLKRERDRS